MAKKKEKLVEFQRLKKGDLEKMILEKKGELVGLGFDLSAGKVKNIRQIKETKRDIARLNTILKQKA